MLENHQIKLSHNYKAIMRMREGRLALTVFFAGLIVIVLLKIYDIINIQAAVFLFLVLMLIAAYLRDERELLYRELTDNVF